ncbi:MAG: hypothetical protein HN742_01825 [Lentisphaerae bacterium]|jgi:hypothetical protein|nr:hypothetical protein [Lentisphaerota bacterium]MBT4823350.1 hypothetical protein [Lentisphaerota bacterium]MBT5612346.1 hypothetical protein [Lentisphaerota bacterium]MBT7056650.1 hypothetical protein [Lentisphaerota bacterium]MBT7840575.1 hypothetical protein [Lentisphaerota bacterium]
MAEESIFTLHDDWGHAEISPRERIPAAGLGTWTLTYRAGANGINVGGSLRIIPPYHGNVIWDVGKVTAVADRPGVALEVQTDKTHPRTFHHSMYPVITVVVYGRPIEPDETISVILGDTGGYNSGRFIHAQAQDHAAPATFEVYVDTIGNARFNLELAKRERYHAVPGELEIEVVAGKPERFRLSLRHPPAPGQPAAATLTAEDRYENVVKDFQGEVILQPTAPIEGLPQAVRPTPDSGGSVTFEFPAPAPGAPVYVAATDWRSEMIGTSNPLQPDFFDGYEAYFGDLHVMTGQCGNKGMMGGTEEALAYARYNRGLDFGAVTNSGSDFSTDGPIFAKYHEPHTFVTMPARECGYKSGHKNVYVLDEGLGCPSGTPLEALWTACEQHEGKGGRAMVISHHPNTHSETDPYVAWGAVNLDRINLRWERVIEICQTRASFEVEDIGREGVVFGGFGSSIQSALAKGLRLGFVGGTDNHRARPGSKRSNQSGLDANEFVNGGLTCVLAKELTREAVFQAIWDRRCYATTSVRTLLDMRVNDAVMGSEIRADGPRTVRVRAVGTADIARVVVVRNGVDIYTKQGDGRVLEFEWQDATPLGDVAAPDGSAYYYVRLVLSDGNLAWASPVWVDPS